MFEDHDQLGWMTLLLLFVVCVPVAAPAQTVASSLDQLRELVRVGDDVMVTDLQGRMTRGRILEISSASLGLAVGGTRIDVAGSDLDTVNKRDSRVLEPRVHGYDRHRVASHASARRVR